VPLPVLIRWRPAPRRIRAGALPVDRVLVLVDIAARRTPRGTTCLARTVAARWLLAREGVEASVHIGVARRGQALAAHAWLQRDGVVLGCREHERDGYEELVGLEGGRPA
jgi:transglutaminase superfamily protein